MKFYQLSKENGKNITQFKSNFIMSLIINTEVPASIGCMYLEENGVIGYHQAVVPQLLLILEGKGYVRNEQEHYYQVQPGDAVFWEKDKRHETKTDKGLTGIVIESEQLNPAAFMPIK
ncbi:cupin domain-containing protein [Lysinibacillus sp. NPDC093190]|uniref:cupin domain-containing protein n=1 Tax=Lysinibacillus sp. NPDC093190 TaxID=3390575 RepID=UPI003D038DF6